MPLCGSSQETHGHLEILEHDRRVAQLLEAARRALVLLQGYPKTKEALEELERACGGCARALLLEASGEVATERLLARRRVDDQPELIERRARHFKLQAEPMLEVLKARALVDVVDASRPVDEVFATACQALDGLGG